MAIQPLRLDPITVLGKQLVIELFDCVDQRFDDIQWIEESMLEAARQANATIITSAFHKFSPIGISGVVVIAESHLAIHTWPEYGYAAVDVFTCGDVLDGAQAGRGGLALQPTGGRGAGRRQRIPGTGKLFGLCGGVAGVPRDAAGLSPRGARLAPLERLDSACARPRFAAGRCRRHGPDRLLRTAVRRRPGGGPALAQPGPERGPRLALRHAAGRALVRLLDP